VDNKSDTVTVDLGAGGNFILQEGLLFEGGSGKQTDTLVIRGTAGPDQYEVGTDLFVVNELAAQFKDVDQIRLEGKAGDDTYNLLGLGVPVVLSETSGVDTVSFSYALSAVTIDLSKAKGQWQQVLAGSAKLALKGNIENVVGSTWADIIRGNGTHNRIWGWGGNDTLYGGAGNDWLFGGEGNDRLFGDTGNDIVVGGEGDDAINAGTGRNLLIGGLGDDNLKGSSGEDILIGGRTNYDEEGTALQAIMAEWTSRHSFAVRIRNLTNGWGLNGQYVLWLGVTIHEDYSLNILSGGAGTDWFLFFISDTVTDRGSKDR
jgi:Ca2+-binding RTX toxin-like protein